MTDYPESVREYERWARLHRTAFQQKNGIAKADAAIRDLKAIIERWEPLIDEHDDLCDLLADWTTAADRHGVPDGIAESPELAFDHVLQRAEQAEAEVAIMRQNAVDREAEVARATGVLWHILDMADTMGGDIALPDALEWLAQEHPDLAARYEAEADAP